MHHCELGRWQHAHIFEQDGKRPAETALRWVIAVTVVTMAIEIAAGLAFASMALLADGMHMATHALALAIAAAAYALARRLAGDARFSFGSGKLNALAGFTSGLLLALFALATAVESGRRLLAPVAIDYDQAIVVAVLGLAVNAGCLVLLRGPEHGHEHRHGHEHQHGHDRASDGPAHRAATPAAGADLNLRSAYLHVLADLLTSVLAIAALLAAKLFESNRVDAVVGLFGAVLVARWCREILGASAAVLLDRQAPPAVHQTVTAAIEADGDARVADLHIWSIGPGIFAAALTVIAHVPRTPEAYRARLPSAVRIVHATIEVHGCCPRADAAC